MSVDAAALPRDFNPTTALPPAVDAYTRKYTQNAQNNRTYNPTETCVIVIPSGRPGAMLQTQNSYLRFDVTFPSITTLVAANQRLRFSGLAGASNLIGALRVYVNGSTASECLNYGQVAEIIHDQTSGGGRANVLDTMCGAYPTLLESEATPSVTGEETNVNPQFVGQYNASSNIAVAGATTAFTRTFCVPLIDGVLGTLAQKALPVSLFAPSSIELHITWASQFQGMCVGPIQLAGANAVAAIPWTVSNVSFVGQEVYLPSVVSEAMLASVPQGLSLYTNALHNYTSSTGAAASPQIILSTNFASVNSLMFTFQPTAALNFSYWCQNRRVKPTAAVTDVVTAQLQIGSERVPQVATSGDSQIMAEVLQAFAALNDRDYCPAPQMARKAFTALTLSSAASFLIAYDLDSFTLESDSVRSGRSLVGQQTVLSLTGLDASAYQVQTYVHHDCKLVIRPGGAVSIYW